MKNMFRFIYVVFVALSLMMLFDTTAAAKGNDTILSGISMGDIDISGMTAGEATEAGDAYIESLSLCTVLLQGEDGKSVELTGADFGITWQNRDVVKEALSMGRSGNAVARYKKRKDIETDGYHFSFEIGLDQERLQQIIDENSAGFGKKAVNPTLVRDNGEFVIKGGQTGLAVDKEATIAAITEAISSSSGNEPIEVTFVSTVEDPSYKEAELAKVKDLIGSFTTSFKSSNADRSGNVRNGASKIDATVLFPGEEFSTYDAVKPFTTDNGYFMAGSYLNGMVVDSMGGGICQVSTTLYNAVLNAELEITERHSHSMVVSYVQVSGDAAIAESSGKDFRFVNNYDFPIYIEGITTEDKKITFNIYGVETRPEGRSVSYENEIIQTINPDYERIVPDAGQGIGYVKVQSAHVGYKAKLWKIVKENGVEVSREQINSSSYSMSPRTAVVGTATANPQRQAEIMAAIATANIEHVRNVAAALLAQEQAEMAGIPY